MRSRKYSSVLRVRDLVHGFVELTQPEVEVLNHPLFQRLRHVRQNDVAFFVYPSLNISRFEHALGCAHVVGKMAINLAESSGWETYSRDVGLSREDIVQVSRLYALLHDIGHLPLSHLFETAFEDYVYAIDTKKLSLEEYCKRWFGVAGFQKLHEACGAAIAPQILDSISAASKEVKRAVRRLMTTKNIPSNDPLYPLKLLVDSDVDGDRIDATARDGLLAGQEYGNYDIERLCGSVFVQKRGGHWRIAYSHKALGSIEGLLLDRCRTHTWIHFHHRVVAVKAAASYVICKLLTDKAISKNDFPVSRPAVMALRDDVWLWSKIREYALRLTKDDLVATACVNALLYRKNEDVRLMWKNRTEYQEVMTQLTQKLTKAAVAAELNPTSYKRDYEKELSAKLGATTIIHWLKFNPIAKDSLTPLTDERGKSDRGHLLNNSPLVASLQSTWRGETQFYVLVLGKTNESISSLRNKWVDFTFKWARQPRVNA